jgi:hypothetical protein
MSIGDALDRYFAAKEEIQEAFGYVQNWRDFPIEDNRGEHWMIVGGEDSGGRVVYSPEPLTAESLEAGDKIYSGAIYTQRHMEKWVWRTESHVMALVDTETDMNVFLMVFDAALEVTDEDLMDLA